MVCILCHCFFKYSWLPANCTCVCYHHRCRTNPIKYWYAFVLASNQAFDTRNFILYFVLFSDEICIVSCFRKCKCQNDIHWFHRHVGCCGQHNSPARMCECVLAARCACYWMYAIFGSICGFMELLSLDLKCTGKRMCICPLTFLYKTIKYENKSEQLHRTRAESQFCKAFIF